MFLIIPGGTAMFFNNCVTSERALQLVGHFERVHLILGSQHKAAWGGSAEWVL